MEVINLDPIEIGERFTILDDEGIENELEVLASIELDGTTYVAVSFVEDLLEEDLDEIDLFFLKVDDEGDFVPIEEDDEFEKVSAAFEDLVEEDEEDLKKSDTETSICVFFRSYIRNMGYMLKKSSDKKF